MSDRVCIRGCVQSGVHWAACENYSPAELIKKAHAEDSGIAYEPKCRGCAPRECRDGSLICDPCFGRIRALLSDTPDLLARLRSIGDPSKATPTDQVRVRGTQTELPAPIGADLLDAIRTVQNVAGWWVGCGQDLRPASNDRYTVEWLSEYVLDRHAPVDGLRPAWSVQDAVDRWGVERRDRNPSVFEDEVERDVIVTPVPEWPRPLMTRDEAVDFAGSARTLQRWVRDELVVPVRPEMAGVVLVFYRPDELENARETAKARKAAGMFKGEGI